MLVSVRLMWLTMSVPCMFLIDALLTAVLPPALTLSDGVAVPLKLIVPVE